MSERLVVDSIMTADGDNQYGGTCRNVYPNNEDHHCDNGFRCSACGDTVEDCENYRVSGTWNYCPKCGAKVVG